MTAKPNPIAAKAARTNLPCADLSNKALTSATVTKYLIGHHDMEMIYLSLDPYRQIFEEQLDLNKCNLDTHRTASLCFIIKNSRLILALMDKSTPGACINEWCTHICGAWLVSANKTSVSSIQDVQDAFATFYANQLTTCTLMFSHPNTSPDISHNGLPISSHKEFSNFTHDQLNNHLDLLKRGPRIRRVRQYDIVISGDVWQYTTQIMRLTHGRLLKQEDWTNWQHSEYLQLDQYANQGCFGAPMLVKKDDAVFHLVWTYNIKAVDG
jgi:hypothetical protein